MIKTVLKRIFNYNFHIRGILNPFINIRVKSIGKKSGVRVNKRELPVIVNITSYKNRFKDLPKTIYSLLDQTFKPDRVILWLDGSLESLTELPYDITRYIKNGLEIRFVKDIGSYTKAIYAFKEFPDSIIVTADDDIYYPKNWLKYLYLSYVSNPENIHCHRAHRVKLKNRNIVSYEKWEKHIDEETARYDNFLTGAGGVLYPPCCFSKEVLREDIFLKYAPKADDIWFWIMALVHGKKIRVVKNHYKTLICTNILHKKKKKTLYSENRNGKNDKQLKNLLKFYSNNVMIKLNEN